MTRGLLLPQVGDDPVELAVRAEELGYGSAWLGELWWRSSPVTLTQIATRTDDIGLGTAILNVFSRSPAVLAMTAASIDRVSDGRFTLGVGTSTAKAVEDLHGMPFDRPVRRAHESIDLVRRFLSSEGQVEYDGELFDVADFPSLGADVPVYHAALGPANRRVVARLCDGWIPHNVPFPKLDEAFDYVREHTPADRDADDITVAPYVPSAVADDPEAARDAVRGHVAYYVGNGEGYRNAVAEQFPEEAERVAAAWRDGDRETAAGRVTDEMVAALGVAGTPEEAREQFAAIESMEVVDQPLVTVPSNATHLAEGTVEALAPDAT
ncbi:LLM class flavin-dependent oxidoreductase [Halorarius halobius]|uniref:LLM class flavin-dependent oxidoreductase n=1 Tax=Halorarius halobius TaxID=2962671 RepID=UPI0020CC38CF|nr:LLM class flavin-dependent oxidoreductase [Halorarius halobius]